MKAPLSWLRAYVDIDMSPEDLASRLALSGTEVERVSEVGVPGTQDNLERFVVGKVLECDRHPNADKLSVCRVEVGDGRPRTIVCGAPNVKTGQTVATVLPGGELLGGMVIKEAKLRGVASEGMLLSEAELGLATKSAGIMELPDRWSEGELLAGHFSLSDTVLEVEVTPNRPDCLSIMGLAREIAAVTGRELKRPGVAKYDIGARKAAEDISIEVTAPDLCPRYAGRVIRGVTIGESPLWLKAWLAHAGLRPISNAVDITNYVLWALGQPLHAFDLRTIRGGKIVVRRGRPGETLTTLDGQARVLTDDMLVIADADRASVVAGVMGGLESEITPGTEDILLEGANFWGPSIMRTSAALGLRSEASTRYEKGLDPEAIDAALDLACSLLAELCGGVVSAGTVDVRTAPRGRAVIELRNARITKVLGIDVPVEQTEALLGGLGCAVDRSDGVFNVTVPTFRADLQREIDLIEEVARIYGLERIPETQPARQTGRGGLNRTQALVRRVEDVLEGAGLAQVLNYSFADRKWPDVLRLADDDPRRTVVSISNPLSADQSTMRTMLLPGLLDTAKRNVAVRAEHVAMFETGRVYIPGEDKLPAEPMRAGVLIAGEWEVDSWLRSGVRNGFYLGRGIVQRVCEALQLQVEYQRHDDSFLHPGRSALVSVVGGGELGWIGELHPSIIQAYDLRAPVVALELDLGALLAAVPAVVPFTDLLAYPAVEQDVAFVVDPSLPAAALVETVKQAGGGLLREVRVFDLYEGEQIGAGKKSIALRLSFRSAERTLSEEEVNRLREEIVAAVCRETGGTLRS